MGGRCTLERVSMRLSPAARALIFSKAASSSCSASELARRLVAQAPSVGGTGRALEIAALSDAMDLGYRAMGADDAASRLLEAARTAAASLPGTASAQLARLEAACGRIHAACASASGAAAGVLSSSPRLARRAGESTIVKLYLGARAKRALRSFSAEVGTLVGRDALPLGQALVLLAFADDEGARRVRAWGLAGSAEPIESGARALESAASRLRAPEGPVGAAAELVAACAQAEKAAGACDEAASRSDGTAAVVVA